MTAHRLGWGTPGLDRTERIPCPGIQLNVRPDVVPLFRELVRWLTVERARLGAPPLESSGGYHKRLVRGSPTAWSNHSWGIAVDFNAATNPMQTVLRTDMPPGTSAKAKSLGMRWGGDYTGRKDPMHFEMNVTPAEAAHLIAHLRDAQADLKPKSPTPAPTVQEDDMPGYLFDDGEKTYIREGGDTIHLPEPADIERYRALGFKHAGQFSPELTARLVEAAKQ